MKSLVVKRSIVIAGHKTSVSLEEPFWLGLKEIAHGQHIATNDSKITGYKVPPVPSLREIRADEKPAGDGTGGTSSDPASPTQGMPAWGSTSGN